jgi:hypothetical protein
VLGKLVQWVTSVTPESSGAVAALEPGRLPAVTALLGLSALKAAVNEWEANAENGSEAFWQEALARHSFVLSHLFAHPLVVIQERAYLGGKALEQGGGVDDDHADSRSSRTTTAAGVLNVTRFRP